VRFPHCAKLSKNWPTCQYTYEISLDEELLQDPGGGRAAWVLKNGAFERFYFGGCRSPMVGPGAWCLGCRLASPSALLERPPVLSFLDHHVVGLETV